MLVLNKLPGCYLKATEVRVRKAGMCVFRQIGVATTTYTGSTGTSSVVQNTAGEANKCGRSSNSTTTTTTTTTSSTGIRNPSRVHALRDVQVVVVVYIVAAVDLVYHYGCIAPYRTCTVARRAAEQGHCSFESVRNGHSLGPFPGEVVCSSTSCPYGKYGLPVSCPYGKCTCGFPVVVAVVVFSSGNA